MPNEGETRPADLSALRIEARDRESGGGRRRGLWIGIGVAAALLVAWIVASALGRKAEVEVAQARPGSGAEGLTVLNASGYVTPRRKATVAAKITGRVKEVLVDEGMKVSEGQVLATLDDADARASFAAARAERDVAQASLPGIEASLREASLTLGRDRDLLKDGFVDQASLDQAQANHDSLEAQLEVARRQVASASARMAVADRDIQNCTVEAPFAGIVVSKDAQPGEMVSPVSAGGGFTRTGIATIVDMASLEIEVDVNEASIAKVTPGQRVEATLDAYPDWKIPCSVRTVIPTADRQKATVKVRVSFDALDPRILPDMGIKVAFLGEPAPAGAPQARSLVPREAVRQEAGKPAVFVVKDGRARRRAVSLGQTLGDDVEVMAGVDPGESVVVAGPAKLRDGQRVVVKKG